MCSHTFTCTCWITKQVDLEWILVIHIPGTNPAPLDLKAEPLSDGRKLELPVAITASNRPHYLFRMIRSILSAHGANPSMMTVFIDGYFDEPLAVARLFSVRGIQHTPISSKNARISQVRQLLFF